MSRGYHLEEWWSHKFAGFGIFITDNFVALDSCSKEGASKHLSNFRKEAKFVDAGSKFHANGHAVDSGTESCFEEINGQLLPVCRWRPN